ncbi:MAG: hypothetical protein ABIB61_01060 [Candidatus Shapirobacteria bacterium]
MNTEALLSKGLEEGFGGKTVRENVQRGPFELESSHYETEEGNVYHDEWLANRVGGGQEIVEVDGKRFTRVYAGGTVSEEILESLGLTKKEVIAFLKGQITKNGDEIRLYEDFGPESEGDWQYEYQIMDREDDIPVTTGKESIFYQGELVFVHVFALSPIE